MHATYERSSFDAAGHAERLESFLTGPSPRLTVWLATSDGQSIGYAAVTREFSTWRAREYLHLDCLFVVEPFRSQGVGRRLLLAVRKFARAAGLDEVQWQTPQWNESAIRFYLRAGALEEKKSRFVLAVRPSRYFLPACASLPSLGAPVPDEPTNSRLPSANVSSRPLPLSDPSFARNPSTTSSAPCGSEFFVKPRR